MGREGREEYRIGAVFSNREIIAGIVDSRHRVVSRASRWARAAITGRRRGWWRTAPDWRREGWGLILIAAPLWGSAVRGSLTGKPGRWSTPAPWSGTMCRWERSCKNTFLRRMRWRWRSWRAARPWEKPWRGPRCAAPRWYYSSSAPESAAVW